MANLPAVTKQLKQERDRVERQLSGLNAALTAFANVYGGGKPIRRRRKMSAKSKAKIAAAQFIKITSAPGKYATLSGKGDLLVAPKAQAAEFTVTEASSRVASAVPSTGCFDATSLIGSHFDRCSLTSALARPRR